MIILYGPSACGKTEVAKLLASSYSIKKGIRRRIPFAMTGTVSRPSYLTWPWRARQPRQP